MKKMTVLIALLLVVAQLLTACATPTPAPTAGPGRCSDDGASCCANDGPRGCSDRCTGSQEVHHRHFESVHQQRVSHADDSGIEGRECRVHEGRPDE